MDYTSCSLHKLQKLPFKWYILTSSRLTQEKDSRGCSLCKTRVSKPNSYGTHLETEGHKRERNIRGESRGGKVKQNPSS